MSTFQCKFNYANLFGYSWDISQQNFYTYWWPDILVVCCCFYIYCIYADSSHLRLLSGTVHTGMEVRRIDSEMSRLVERPWLQLMCCAVCLPHGHNFRWKRGSPSGSEYWLVCRCWTPEIEFNESLSLSIIRLVNYSVTTSLIYKLIL